MSKINIIHVRSFILARGSMNSSPPLPSFTLPPLNSAGQFPITPSPTPSPDKEHAGHDFQSRSKSKKLELAEDEAGGRISMYVRLFEGESVFYVITIPDGKLTVQK